MGVHASIIKEEKNICTPPPTGKLVRVIKTEQKFVLVPEEMYKQMIELIRLL